VGEGDSFPKSYYDPLESTKSIRTVSQQKSHCKVTEWCIRKFCSCLHFSRNLGHCLFSSSEDAFQLRGHVTVLGIFGILAQVIWANSRKIQGNHGLYVVVVVVAVVVVEIKCISHELSIQS